jgi:hypothetical protein
MARNERDFLRDSKRKTRPAAGAGDEWNIGGLEE